VVSHGDHPVLPVPPSLGELLSGRVARLSPDARQLLLLVTAAGRLTVTQLQTMVDPAQLRSVLDAVADADIALVGAGAVVTFTHPLLASAIYQAATPGERRRAHRVLADGLEDPVERARHRARTTTAPDSEIADEIERAADTSRRRGARHLAGELLERAALATPNDLDTTTGLDRWLRAVDTYLDAGDTLAAQIALDKGSALAVAPEQRAQVLVRRARLAGGFREARSVAELAFRTAPAGSEVRAETLSLLAMYRRLEGHGRLSQRFAQTAIASAAATGRPDIELAALGERMIVERLWGLGNPAQTMDDIERLVQTTELEVSFSERAAARAFYAPWNDDVAEQQVRAAIAWSVDAGRYGDLATLYICLVMVLIRGSRIHAAQNALDEADRSGAWTSGGIQEAMARILVTGYAGALTDSRDLVQRALANALVNESPYWRGGYLAQLGFIEVSARDWQAALVPLRELADIVTTTKIADLEQLLWAVDYADAALQVGAMQEVETAVALLRRQAAAGRPEAAVAAQRCAAMLTAARGDTESALNTLRTIVGSPGSECPFEAARSRMALGQVYRRAGFKALADETLTTAADTFQSLGTPRWAERARDEAGRIGLHPTNDTLTVTERRVAELVGAGHSNQEAAAELFMSVKTVEANLTRIYRKLSVRSRTELANYMNKPPTPGADAQSEPVSDSVR
jgi:DNA-binding CsgD family transcriptional regulator